MTVLGSGESAIEEGNRLRSGSTGERGGGPELGLEFGARSLPKRLRKSKDCKKDIVEQSVNSMDNIGVENPGRGGSHDLFSSGNTTGL